MVKNRVVILTTINNLKNLQQYNTIIAFFCSVLLSPLSALTIWLTMRTTRFYALCGVSAFSTTRTTESRCVVNRSIDSLNPLDNKTIFLSHAFDYLDVFASKKISKKFKKNASKIGRNEYQFTYAQNFCRQRKDLVEIARNTTLL